MMKTDSSLQLRVTTRKIEKLKNQKHLSLQTSRRARLHFNNQFDEMTSTDTTSALMINSV